MIMRGKVTHLLMGVPTGLSGLALAIAALGWCWEISFALQGKMQVFSALLATPLLLLLLLKYLFNPRLLIADIRHHLSGSVLATFSMAVMVVAHAMRHISPSFALLLWLSAVLLHLFFMLCFSYYHLQGFKLEHLLPSWFIAPVGVVVIILTMPSDLFAAQFVASALLRFSGIAYAILLPIISYRCLMLSALTESEKPTIAIFAAPASLLLAGYLTISEQPHPLLLTLLVSIALTMTLLVYLAFNKLLRLPFSPAYSAFTFPLVIGATAMFKTEQYLVQSGASDWLGLLVASIAYVELLVATLMVAYVCLAYMKHFNPRCNDVS